MKPKKSNTLVTFNIEKNVKPKDLSLPDCPAEIQSILEFLKENQLPVVIMVNVVNQTIKDVINSLIVGNDVNNSNINLVNGNCSVATERNDNTTITESENIIVNTGSI